MRIHIPASSQNSEFNNENENLLSPTLQGSLAYQNKVQTTIKKILESKLV